MTQPRLFGISASRALRAIWGMEEVGIDCEQVPVTYGADSKTPDHLAVNPNGRIPALIDGDLQLFESMAINLYLTKRYGGALYPSQRGGRAVPEPGRRAPGRADAGGLPGRVHPPLPAGEEPAAARLG